MEVQSIAVFFLITSFLLFTPVRVGAVSFGPGNCMAQNGRGVEINFTNEEFFSVYSQTFKMSDGSKISDTFTGIAPDEPFVQETLAYMKTLMSNIKVVEKGTQAPGFVRLEVCNEDIIRLLLLGILGNFVTSPTDPNLSSQSSSEFLASVVVDVYTGKLVLVNSYNLIRSYFLETLLIISIIAIARLALVRNITMKEVHRADGGFF